MTTPDQSRALAIYVNKYPERRPEVVATWWDGLTSDQQMEAEQMFVEEWGRDMRGPV